MSYNDITKSKKEKQKMNENTTNKRKVGIFTAVSLLISYGAGILANIISAAFPADSGAIENLAMYNLINDIPSYIASVITLAVFLIMGYILTKDKKKTVIFAGALCFGRNAVSILNSLIVRIAKIVIAYDSASAYDIADLQPVINIALSPLVIFAAYFAYTCFEGINTKLSGQSLENSQMTLSRARKRYLAYSIIGGIAIGAVSSGINYLINYFAMYDFNPAEDVISFDFTISASAISWLSNSALIVLTYIAGYKPFKNHVDAMAFIGVDGLASIIVGLFSRLIHIIYSYIVNTVFIGTDNIGYTYSLVSSIYATTSGLLVTVATYLIALYLFKYFFAQAKISLFSEAVEISEEELPVVSDIPSEE